MVVGFTYYSVDLPGEVCLSACINNYDSLVRGIDLFKQQHPFGNGLECAEQSSKPGAEEHQRQRKEQICGYYRRHWEGKN